MSRTDGTPSIAELLRGRPIEWPELHPGYDVVKHVAKARAVIVFEDEFVIAYEAGDRAEAAAACERRVTIEPKQPLASLLEFGPGSAQIATHLLVALQRVAFQLSLHRTGFEVRLNVLPPYQRRPHLSLELRSGDSKRARG